MWQLHFTTTPGKWLSKKYTFSPSGRPTSFSDTPSTPWAARNCQNLPRRDTTQKKGGKKSTYLFCADTSSARSAILTPVRVISCTLSFTWSLFIVCSLMASFRFTDNYITCIIPQLKFRQCVVNFKAWNSSSHSTKKRKERKPENMRNAGKELIITRGYFFNFIPKNKGNKKKAATLYDPNPSFSSSSKTGPRASSVLQFTFFCQVSRGVCKVLKDSAWFS